MLFIKKSRWYILTFIAIIIVLLMVIKNLNHAITEENIKKVQDQLQFVLENQLEKERSSALRFALVLSQNESLHQALIDDDEEKGYAVLSKIMDTIKYHTNSLLRAQIITDEYTIFARSWDNSFAGMPLDEYRPDLLYFQKNKNPRSAIEVGRKLGFKATVPVYNGKEILGYIEVLQFFEPLSAFFQDMGLDLFILMNDDFYGIAIFMQDNATLGPYILASSHYNGSYLDKLEDIDFERLKIQKHLLYNDRYIFYFPMLNGEKQEIGAFIFAIQKHRLESLVDKEEDLSFLINFSKSDLYSVVKKEEFDESLLQSNYDKVLLNIHDLIDQEEKELFRQEAFDRLNEYSKKELISLLLNYKFTKEIKGDIQ